MNAHTGRPIVTHGPTRLSNADILDLLTRHGFPNVEAWVQVVLHESGGDPAVMVDTTGMSSAELHAYWKGIAATTGLATEVSVGLFQLNIAANAALLQRLGVGHDAGTLQDPDENAKAAFALSTGGTNFSPWGGHGTTPPSYVRVAP